MKRHAVVGLISLHVALAGSLLADTSPLARARQDFATHLIREMSVGEAPERPPSGVLNLVTYQGSLGAMAAYVSPSPKNGKRNPAIIWLVGGFSNSIGDIAWTPGPKQNDQSATGFREAGIVMMSPSLRGGNQNPGHLEAFYGEVDDVIAAARYLAQLDYVDPNRIYLGGHSTGGTLALLVAASTDRFRAVFALGPVGDIRGYGQERLPFDTKNPREGNLRAPQLWLDSIRRRTFVFEGTKAPSNIGELRTMSGANKNSVVGFQPIPGGTHFSIIAPLVREIARQILGDEGKTMAIEFKDLDKLVGL